MKIRRASTRRRLGWLSVAMVVTVSTPVVRASAEPPPAEPARGGLAPAPEPLPTLGRVLDLARDRAPSVVVGRADVNVARASFVGARLAPVANPSFSLLFDRGAERVTKDVTVAGSLVVPVEIAGQRATRVAEAQALVDWQEADLETTKAMAAGDAARAYGAVVVAAERVRTIEAMLGVARNEAEVYRARLASSDATEQDAQLARAELARNAVALAESRADLTRALVDLERLVGRRFAPPPRELLEPPLPRLAASTSPPPVAPIVRSLEKEASYHASAKARASREGFAPLDLVLTAGRGDLGEARFGGGVAWSFPLARRNQGEQARADASRIRASVEKDERARFVRATLDGLSAERVDVRVALAEIVDEARPAAEASVKAALETQQAGKGELLRVLTARRDLALVELRRLELIAREWNIVADAVALTGELP